jgi:hypothetical protein
MKAKKVFGIFYVLFLFLFVGGASAQEIEIPLFSSLVSSDFIFEEGHAGDQTRIVGFNYVQDYLIGDPKVKIGTETGEVRLPDGQYFSPLTPVREGQVTATLTVPGIGNFSSRGTIIGLGGPSAAATGDVIVSWLQSYFDGTGSFAGFYGLGSGTGKLNLVTNEGENSFKMILMPPISQ